MPELSYSCNLCSNKIMKIVFKSEDIKGYLVCQAEITVGYEEDGSPIIRTCGGVMERVLKAPTTKIVERRDNGAMARSVEHISVNAKDMKEIMTERSNNARIKKD